MLSTSSIFKLPEVAVPHVFAALFSTEPVKRGNGGFLFGNPVLTGRADKSEEDQ